MSMLEQDRPELAASTGGPDPSSPLGRLRSQQADRQRKAVDDVPVPTYDNLVARVTIIDDSHASAGVLKLGMRLSDDDSADDSDLVNIAASVIAAAVTGLYSRDEDGNLEPIMDEHGIPVRFDERYGQAVGIEGVSSGVGAVFAAFTQGDPPRVNGAALLMFAARAAGFSTGQDMEGAVKGP